MLEITIKKSNGSVVKLGEEKKTNTYKKLTRKEYRMKKSAKNFNVTIEKANREEVKPVEEPKIEEESKVVEAEPTVMTETDRLCKQLEVTITKGRDTYVGKSVEPAYSNSYDIYGSAGYLYGDGASLVKDDEDETPTVYSDDVPMTNNMPEVVKAIMNTNRKAEAVEDVETESTEEDETPTVYSDAYHQEFDSSEDDEEDDSEYYNDEPEVYEGEVVDEEEILDEF